MKMTRQFVVLTCTLLCLGYASQAQTTQDEYNYITKGLKLQQDAGLDMKKGYRLQLIGRYTDAFGLHKITFEFYDLFKYRLTTFQKKGIVIKTLVDGETRYALIPAAGTPAALVEQCQRDLDIHKDTDYDNGSDFPQYLLCLARALSFLTSQLQAQPQ